MLIKQIKPKPRDKSLIIMTPQDVVTDFYCRNLVLLSQIQKSEVVLNLNNFEIGNFSQ